MEAIMASERPTAVVDSTHLPLSRYVLYFATAVIGLTIDLLTKHVFFASPALRSGDIWWLWPDHVGIQLSLNEGALFGFGQGKVWLFATLSILAAIAIPTWLFVYRAARDAWLTFALGCITVGVLGNLYDRLGLHGIMRSGEPLHAVRDWVLWQANNNWRWPNFNIADSFLVVGAALLFFHACWQPAAAAPQST
jgi:signal peptidase II